MVQKGSEQVLSAVLHESGRTNPRLNQYAVTVSTLGTVCKMLQRLSSYEISRTESLERKYTLADLLYYSTQTANGALHILTERLGCSFGTALCYPSPSWDQLVNMVRGDRPNAAWTDVGVLVSTAVQDQQIAEAVIWFPDLANLFVVIRDKLLPLLISLGVSERQTAQPGSFTWTTQPGHLRSFSLPTPIPAPLRPARPAFFKISEANDVPEKDPISDLESAARLTHMSLVSLETVSVELISSYFTQFPETDTTIQMLLARHCFDEARHCRLLWNLLRSLGKNIDTYTHIDIRTWVVNQQLKTLSQKVAVSHRLLESFGVEGCASVALKLRQLGLAEAAMTYEIQHIDEIAHVRSADSVVRRLEGDNYTDFMRKSFDWFVREVPRVQLVIDETVRAAEGFTNEEISRFKSWN